MAALAVAASKSPTAEAALVSVLLPLLLDAAAPQVDVHGPAHPVLKELAIKLITHLATGPSAQVFRTAVAGLPPASKQRLQGALQQQQQQGGVGQRTTGDTKRATIQLKQFGA